MPLGRLLVISFLLAGCTSFQPAGRFDGLSDFNGPGSVQSRSPQLQYLDSKFNLRWPIERARLTQSFRPRRNPSHQGLDLAAPLGTHIYSAHPGVVIYAGNGYRGYGRMVIVEYNKTWASLYGHLNRIHVRPGQTVQAGQHIGDMGRSGRTTGVHLHFELMKNKQPINPINFLNTNHMTAKN